MDATGEQRQLAADVLDGVVRRLVANAEEIVDEFEQDHDFGRRACRHAEEPLEISR